MSSPGLSEITTTLDWVLSHGVQSVEAVVILAQSYVIYKLWFAYHTSAEQRVQDTQHFIEFSNRLHDKIHGTADDLAKVVEFIERRRP